MVCRISGRSMGGCDACRQSGGALRCHHHGPAVAVPLEKGVHLHSRPGPAHRDRHGPCTKARCLILWLLVCSRRVSCHDHAQASWLGTSLIKPSGLDARTLTAETRRTPARCTLACLPASSTACLQLYTLRLSTKWSLRGGFRPELGRLLLIPDSGQTPTLTSGDRCLGALRRCTLS